MLVVSKVHASKNHDVYFSGTVPLEDLLMRNWTKKANVILEFQIVHLALKTREQRTLAGDQQVARHPAQRHGPAVRACV